MTSGKLMMGAGISATGILAGIMTFLTGEGSLGQVLLSVLMGGGGVLAGVIALLGGDKVPVTPIDPNNPVAPVDPSKFGIKDVLGLIAGVMKDGKFDTSDALLILNFVMDWLRRNDPKALVAAMPANEIYLDTVDPKRVTVQGILDPKDTNRGKVRSLVTQLIGVDGFVDEFIDHGGVAYVTADIVCKDKHEVPFSYGKDPRVTTPVTPQVTSTK